MKKILVVSPCGRRRDTIGLIGGLLTAFEKFDASKYHISLLDTNFFESDHNPKDYKVNQYYSLKTRPFDTIIRRIPRIRSIYAEHKAVNRFSDLIKTNQFDIVIIHQIPIYADKLVGIAHSHGVNVVLEPFGSDVLRVTNEKKRHLKVAFSEVDAVVGRKQSNVLREIREEYGVSPQKFYEQREALGGVIRLKNWRGKISRKRMHEEIGIPYSDYNIVCGYSGRESHRHRTIIDALIKVKDILPQGYQIIFPMTYGAGNHHEIIISYATQLKSICDAAGLNTVFMTEFKTYEQMAYLHLITDLFIEIQPTDNGNAFMIEALYAHNQIITGRWLNYQRFEQFGEPYYLLDKPEDLAEKLQGIFTGKIKKVQVPQELIDFFDVPDGYDRGEFYANLFETL